MTDDHETDIDTSINGSKYTILDVYHGRERGLEPILISQALDLDEWKIYDALSRYYKHNTELDYLRKRDELKSVKEGVWEELVNQPREIIEPWEDIDDSFECDDLRIERMTETSIWVRGLRDEDDVPEVVLWFHVSRDGGLQVTKHWEER